MAHAVPRRRRRLVRGQRRHPIRPMREACILSAAEGWLGRSPSHAAAVVPPHWAAPPPPTPTPLSPQQPRHVTGGRLNFCVAAVVDESRLHRTLSRSRRRNYARRDRRPRRGGRRPAPGGFHPSPPPRPVQRGRHHVHEPVSHHGRRPAGSGLRRRHRHHALPGAAVRGVVACGWQLLRRLWRAGGACFGAQHGGRAAPPRPPFSSLLSYNATGQPVYDFCVGRTYMNAFSPNSSIARSVWPTGKARGEGHGAARAGRRSRPRADESPPLLPPFRTTRSTTSMSAFGGAR